MTDLDDKLIQKSIELVRQRKQRTLFSYFQKRLIDFYHDEVERWYTER